MHDMEKKFFLAIYNLVLRSGFIGFFIETPLCALVLSKYFFSTQKCPKWTTWADLAIHNRPIMAIFLTFIARYILFHNVKLFFVFGIERIYYKVITAIFKEPREKKTLPLTLI